MWIEKKLLQLQEELKQPRRHLWFISLLHVQATTTERMNTLTSLVQKKIQPTS